MRVGITGSSGFIGKSLTARLIADGHDVIPFLRGPGNAVNTSTSETVSWNPDAGRLDLTGLRGLDAVVHLAGQPIASRRWSEEQKERILSSRINGTQLLSEVLAGLKTPPDVMVSASAIGVYGNRGDTLLDETSSPGDDFLAEVCEQWEAATAPAKEAGIRVCHPRTGIVLAKHGGALAKMLIPFKFGLGGRIGNGRQWMSWISLQDEVSALCWLLTSDTHGPVNLTAPNPVTNSEFAKTLAQVLKRPAFLPTPKMALSALWGRELAEALLYSSTRVKPSVLQEGGFQFDHPHLQTALEALLT